MANAERVLTLGSEELKTSMLSGETSIDSAQKKLLELNEDRRDKVETCSDAPSGPAEKTIFTGKPSGGTSFNPVEFDASMHVESKDCPKHLIPIIPCGAESRAFVREIQDMKTRLVKYAGKVGGSYLFLQDVERLCDQLKTNLKASEYLAICPGCKHEPLKSCKRCAGRGFISSGQEPSLTNQEKAWLEKQPHKGQYR